MDSPYYTTEDEDACLFVPPFSTLCDRNDCNPAEPFLAYLLDRLQFWNGDGMNHVVFEISDNDHIRYDAERAIQVRSSFHSNFYRPGFDVPVALLSSGTPAAATDHWGLDVLARTVDISFKGTITALIRADLAALHNGDNIQIGLTCRNYFANLPADFCEAQNNISRGMNYSRLLQQSRFGIAIRGFGLHSFRLVETMSAGAIPIIVADDLVLPFPLHIPWHIFSVRVQESQIHRIPHIVQYLTQNSTHVQQMQQLSWYYYRKYFASWRLQTLTVLAELDRNIKSYLGFVDGAPPAWSW